MSPEITVEAHEAADGVSRAVPDEAIKPLIRGITVLQELTAADGTLSLSALERATGLARSTVDRITATLARMGYVRVEDNRAILTPRVMALGNAYLAALRLPALLAARADALADELDESVSLAVADRDGIRFIHQATRRRAMSLSFRIGDLLPAERTAPGPLFATEWSAEDWDHWRQCRAAAPDDRSFPALPPLRRTSAGEDFEQRTKEAGTDGWALDDELIEPGLLAVAVPVRDSRSGRIACVASVVSHTSRHTAEDLRDTLLPRLRAAVAVMETDLREAPDQHPGSAPSGLAMWTGTTKQEMGREFVESLARGLTVLTVFDEGRAELPLTEVAKAAGLARATARRALITLEYLGMVTRPSGSTFAPTARVLSLGYPPLSRMSLPHIAMPHMRELATRIHESTSLAVLSPTVEEIHYTARVAVTSGVMSVNITVGTRLPAYGTSMGRVLLANQPEPQHRFPNLRPLTARTITDPATLSRVLADVRANGYAVVDGELEEGLRSIAVPVRDRSGRVVAALNAATHAVRRTVEECVHDLLPELMTAACRIEADLHVAGRFTYVPLT